MILNITDAIVFPHRTSQVACQSAFLLSASHAYAATVFVAHCCAQFRSPPEYGHTAKVIYAFISFTQSGLRRFFFGVRLALLQGTGVSCKCSHVTTCIGQARFMCVDTGNLWRYP